MGDSELHLLPPGREWNISSQLSSTDTAKQRNRSTTTWYLLLHTSLDQRSSERLIPARSWNWLVCVCAHAWACVCTCSVFLLCLTDIDWVLSKRFSLVRPPSFLSLDGGTGFSWSLFCPYLLEIQGTCALSRICGKQQGNPKNLRQFLPPVPRSLGSCHLLFPFQSFLCLFVMLCPWCLI